jgi:hypothetical protein
LICFLNTAVALTIDEFNEAGEVVSNQTNTTATLIQTGEMIGGTRQLQTTRLSGNLDMSLEIQVEEGGILSHIQDPVTKGTSKIIWDGDNVEEGINPIGLGGINLKQDYATPDPANDGLVLKIYSLDASTPIRVKITVYTNNLKISTITRDLTKPINWPEFEEPKEEVFLFKDFTSLGGVKADFNNVGAIVLEIEGLKNATDFSIMSLTTNGCNTAVPTPATDSLDQCGVICGEDACLDCKGVPDLTGAGPDQPGKACTTGESGICGAGTWALDPSKPGTPISCLCKRNKEPSNEICDSLDNDCDAEVDETFPTLGDGCSQGDGVCSVNGILECSSTGGLRCSAEDSKDDVDECEDSKGCDGVPNSGLKDDECGVCGGNNSSCADCAGKANGPAKEDRCGVCNGDGTTCLDCENHNIKELQAAMDANTKDQENLIKQLRVQIRQVTTNPAFTRNEVREARRNANSLFQEAKKLSDESWHIIWTKLQSEFVECSNTFCTASSNGDAIASFKSASQQLQNLGQAATNLLRQLGKQIKDAKVRRKANRAKNLNNNFYATNINLAETIPMTVSNCDLK